MGGCAHRRQYCQLILATLSVSTFIDDSPNNGGGGPGGATPENDRLGGGGGIRPGAIAIFLRKMLSPWGLQGSLRFRLRRKPQCGWIPPIAWKKISVILAEAEGRRRESRVAVPRSGSAMGVGDGKLHGGYAATLDSRATPENDRLGGGGGIRPGAIAIFLRKMLSPWGLQGSLRFRLRRKPQCGWIPPSPGMTE